MLKPLARSLVLASSLFLGTSFAGIVTVSFDSGGATVTDNLSVPLSGGTAVDGDGYVLQLGYYTGATVGNNFLGTWVPLTGSGSLNTGNIAGSTIDFNETTIGDLNANGAGTGSFALSVTFDQADAGRNQSFPAVGTPLAVRFYDSSSLVLGVTRYNAFSIDSGFTWAAPADAPSQPILNITLDDLGIEWESGPSGANKTTLVLVPEPSAASLLLLGLAGIGFRRKRAAK